MVEKFSILADSSDRCVKQINKSSLRPIKYFGNRQQQFGPSTGRHTCKPRKGRCNVFNDYDAIRKKLLVQAIAKAPRVSSESFISLIPETDDSAILKHYIN